MFFIQTTGVKCKQIVPYRYSLYSKVTIVHVIHLIQSPGSKRECSEFSFDVFVIGGFYNPHPWYWVANENRTYVLTGKILFHRD